MDDGVKCCTNYEVDSGNAPIHFIDYISLTIGLCLLWVTSEDCSWCYISLQERIRTGDQSKSV